MIGYVAGDLLKLPVQAIVNPVNCVGVMGAGLAKQVKDAYPECYRLYAEACRRGEVKTGKILVYDLQLLYQPRYILHFPTKRHWKDPSQLEWIEEGLVDLVRVVREYKFASLGVPALGCGLGGLDWEQVRLRLWASLAELQDVDIKIVPPVGWKPKEA